MGKWIGLVKKYLANLINFSFFNLKRLKTRVANWTVSPPKSSESLKMKRGRKETEDPAWNRNNRKKQKMCSRGSVKILRSLISQKRLADKNRPSPRNASVCVTRTVELPSTHNVGDESNKLLFMIALGLIPKTASDCPNGKNSSGPIVQIERLDPILEADAYLRTTERIFELFQRRKIEAMQQRINHYRLQSSPSPPLEDVEIVDLVSDGEDDLICLDDEDDSDDSSMEPMMNEGNYSDGVSPSPPRSLKTRNGGWNKPQEKPPQYRILSCSSKSRQPVFKSITNNQNHDSGVFRNWKPEAMSKLINPTQSKTTSVNSSNYSKLLISLKSIPKNSFVGKSSSSKSVSGTTSRNSARTLESNSVITLD